MCRTSLAHSPHILRTSHVGSILGTHTCIERGTYPMHQEPFVWRWQCVPVSRGDYCVRMSHDMRTCRKCSWRFARVSTHRWSLTHRRRYRSLVETPYPRAPTWIACSSTGVLMTINQQRNSLCREPENVVLLPFLAHSPATAARTIIAVSALGNQPGLLTLPSTSRVVVVDRCSS